MFDAEGAEITTHIAVKNRHKFKLSTDYTTRNRMQLAL